MLDKLHSFVVIAAHLLAWYGWGGLLTKRLHGGTEGRRVYSMTLGLASWIALGGVLCLLHLATTLVLCAVLLTGLAMALYLLNAELRVGLRKNTRRTVNPEATATLCVGLILIGFLVLTLMPASGLFNIADDFQYYLKRPVRMLTLGSVAGDPFDCVGIDSMGAQSYLHAFFLVWVPLTHLNVLDAILCFTLATCLLLELGRWLRIPWPTRLLSVLLFVAIDPQYVNLSSLYSGSLMILGLLCASVLTAQSLAMQQRGRAMGSGAAAGLFLGALIPLKTTLGPFGLAFAGIFPAAIATATGWRRLPVGAILVFWGVSALVTLGWMASNYAQFAALFGTGHTVAAAYSAHTAPLARLAAEVVSNFASLRPACYGGWCFQYALAGALLLAAAVIGCRQLTCDDESSRLQIAPLVASSFAGVIGTIGVFLMADYPICTPLRYSCPVLLPCLAASVFVCVLARHARAQVGYGIHVWRASLATLLAFDVLLLATFATPVVARAQRIWRTHTLHPFQSRWSLPMVTRGGEMMGRQGLAEARQLQSLTEKGCGILLRVGDPFQYDFARNRIFSVTPAGLVSPQLRLPVGAPPDTLREFLVAMGIRYVIWEYFGMYGVDFPELNHYARGQYATLRDVGTAGLYFYRTLAVIGERSVAICNNGTVTVFDIAPNGLRDDSASCETYRR